ncbi:MAG TPA: M28 family peptidase [Actinokineospora sp.]|nr:M28 family peptidase [Actinokineospora sp.]
MTAGLGAVAIAQQQAPAQAGAPEEVAIAAADRALGGPTGLSGLSGDNQLVRADVEVTKQGLAYVNYTRTYQGLPVLNGGDVVVVTDAAGGVRDVDGDNRRVTLGSTSPVVTARSADTIAKANFGGLIDSASAPRLGVDATGEAKLVWEVVVRGKRADFEHGGTVPSALHVFVDARTGQVVSSWDGVAHADGKGYHNGSVAIGTQQSGSGYQMKDADRGGMSVANDGSKAIYTDSDNVWGNGGANDLPTAAVDVHYAQNKMWDMLKERWGRNGHDGNGQWPEAHVGMNEGNAYSYCESSASADYTRFGRNQGSTNQLTALDVVGHENGHSLDCRTPGGMSRQGEAYGLSESIGDIFGTLTEHYANNPNDVPDYLIGEEVDFGGGGKPLRNMYDPSKALNADPTCWKSGLPANHGSSGPQNHWFYLLAEGSNPGNGKPVSPTCNGASVTGIGVWKAGDIFYHSMLRKTSSWSYAKSRVATLQSAKDLFTSSCTEFATVKAAWDAVSVPAQSGEPTCVIDPPTSTTNPTTTNPTTTTPPTSTTTPPPSGTVPDIDVAKVKAHLDQFQTIADNNSGNRVGGSAGYQASLNYVKGKLEGAGYTTRVHEFTYNGRTGRNLIADLPGRGDPNQVVMLGSHLDSVSAGPGINDNASGSGTALEVALTYASTGAKGDKAIRFGWWDFEESGLIGSAEYVRSLSSTERAKIKAYLNFDMVGSPNGGYFINNITSDTGKVLKAYYDSINVQTEENTEGVGRSDDKSFKDAGIATSGVAAGASNRMTAAQATKWGGQSGVAYDKCYHQSCDTKANINSTVLDRSADAAAYGAWKLTGVTGGPTTTPTTTTPTTTNPTTTNPTTTTRPTTTTPPTTCTAPAWSAQEFYWTGSVVSHKGRKWTALQFSYNTEPGTTGPWGNPWQDSGAC